MCRKDSRAFDALGRYYMMNTYQNDIIDRHVNIVALACELILGGGGRMVARFDGEHYRRDWTRTCEELTILFPAADLSYRDAPLFTLPSSIS
jgi:hypothetical protein